MSVVTVVIPVYNGESYIEQCIHYLKMQTYQDIEVYFVDDGSKDKSGERLDALTQNNNKFHVIHKENGGTARARNTGLDRAAGKYITFLDVDDEYKPDMIETMVGLMEQYHVEMVVCGYYFKIENNKNGSVKTTYLEEKKYPCSVFHNLKEIKKEYVSLWDADMLSNVWNKLYRMDIIRKYGMRYRDGHVYTEDRVFNRLFLSKCQSLVVTDKCLYYYVRERTGSTTEKYRDDSFVIRNKEYHEFKEHFQKLDIWDEKSREYTSREFVERIAGCIENVFHAGRKLTVLQKYERIAGMIHHKDVREAIQYAKCRSFSMRVFVLPIRWDWAWGAYIMGGIIYGIRKRNPVVFHKLKSKR